MLWLSAKPAAMIMRVRLKWWRKDKSMTEVPLLSLLGMPYFRAWSRGKGRICYRIAPHNPALKMLKHV